MIRSVAGGGSITVKDLLSRPISMVYVNIPYVVENDRLDAVKVGRELSVLAISESAKYEAFEAIYHKRPRGVNFSETNDAASLENVLRRLGVPFRRSNESDYKYELMPKVN